MVIVRLAGGLGNQMFQYALGRRLALERDCPLKLDLSTYRHDPLREYRLDCFKTISVLAETHEIEWMVGHSANPLVKQCRQIPQKIRPYYKRRVLVERVPMEFDPNILRASGDVYLVGYWQNARYFEPIDEIVRSEFRLRHPLSPESEFIAMQIDAVPSVAVHVRRGDYATNPKINEIHGICSPDYYDQAMRLIQAREPAAHFFIFSDEPQWVADSLKIDGPYTIVSRTSESIDYEELTLMSHCRHFILANSTFSWWGTWLARSQNKIVIAPRNWFSAPDIDSTGFVPVSWIRL